MWIDTHNHFDFAVFDKTRAGDWAKAQSLGVSAQFVMSISPANFAAVEQLAEHFAGTYFALGIHPMTIMTLEPEAAITALRQAVERNRHNPRFIGIGEIGLDVERNRHNPRFIGIGEIGLDGFIKDSDFNRQVDFFTAQLKIARDDDLPVFMHVRKAQDKILKYCRVFGIEKGIAHAFNGSHQQAERYLAQGFKLGFGGAFTYERAKQLRRLVCDLPLEAFVLETDAPDMPPAWLGKETNYSYHLSRIAKTFAQLRNIDEVTLSQQLQVNTETAVERKII